MGEYARPIEVLGGKGGEGEVRAPQVGPLFGPAGGPEDAGQSLGAALGQAASQSWPPEEPAKLGPLGRLRQTAQAATAQAAERLQAVGLAAAQAEQNLQQAVGEGLSELKRRALEIFTTHYRPSGLEEDVQQRGFLQSKERFDRMSKTGELWQAQAENVPPPLDTKGLTPQPHIVQGRDLQEEQKRRIQREGRSLGD